MNTPIEDLARMSPIESSDVIDLPIDQTELALCQMVSTGKSTKYISEALDKTEGWVRNRKKDPRLTSVINMLHHEALEVARSCIINGTQKAAETIVNIATGDEVPPAVKLAAAKDILDRIGMRAPERKQIDQNVNITQTIPREERLAKITLLAQNLGLVTKGEVIDVDPE